MYLEVIYYRLEKTIFTPTGDKTAILSGPSSHARSSCLQGKGVPSFLSYFKTLSIDPVPGIPLYSQALYRLSSI